LLSGERVGQVPRQVAHVAPVPLQRDLQRFSPLQIVKSDEAGVVGGGGKRILFRHGDSPQIQGESELPAVTRGRALSGTAASGRPIMHPYPQFMHTPTPDPSEDEDEPDVKDPPVPPDQDDDVVPQKEPPDPGSHPMIASNAGDEVMT